MLSAARVFGGNIFLGGTIGMLLMHMNLLSAWTAASDPSQIQYWHILGFNIRQVNYQGHIIPIIIAIWLMCQLEKWLHKHVPEMIDLFVTPLVTVIVTAFLTMTIIGPVFIVVENNILVAAAGTLLGVYGSAYGVTGIPGFLITTDCTLQYTIMLLIAGTIAFVLTWIFWKEEKEDVAIEEAKKSISTDEQISAKESNNEESGTVIYAPVKGNVIAKEEIPDKTFASGILGEGVGIEPEVGEVVAPFDGVIASVMDTKHAVILSGPGNMELMIHVGIDTVKMKGEGFDVFVSNGDTVKKGQKLIAFDLDKIKEAGYSSTTAVLLTNSDKFENVKILKTGKTNQQEEIISAE